LKDEVRTVPGAIGGFFCSNGWAEDVDGKVETGVRDINRVTLSPANVMVGQASTKVGA